MIVALTAFSALFITGSNMFVTTHGWKETYRLPIRQNAPNTKPASAASATVVVGCERAEVSIAERKLPSTSPVRSAARPLRSLTALIAASIPLCLFGTFITLDLLGRKVVMREGAGLKLVASRIGATFAAASKSGDPQLCDWAAVLQATLAHIEKATRTLWSRGDADGTLAYATPYMQAFGHLVVAWIWLDMSCAALATNDATLRQGVWAACRYFFGYEIPRVRAWLVPAEQGDRSVQDLHEDWL